MARADSVIILVIEHLKPTVNMKNLAYDHLKAMK